MENMREDMNLPHANSEGRKPRILVLSPSVNVYDHDCVKWYDQTKNQVLENKRKNRSFALEYMPTYLSIVIDRFWPTSAEISR